jgi:ethanolamine utilization microcompartment shell protein EutS
MAYKIKNSYFLTVRISNLIKNVKEKVRTRGITETSALGIIETFSVASIIEAADAAVKAANVQLLQIHLPWPSAAKDMRR